MSWGERSSLPIGYDDSGPFVLRSVEAVEVALHIHPVRLGVRVLTAVHDDICVFLGVSKSVGPLSEVYSTHRLYQGCKDTRITTQSSYSKQSNRNVLVNKQYCFFDALAYMG